MPQLRRYSPTSFWDGAKMATLASCICSEPRAAHFLSPTEPQRYGMTVKTWRIIIILPPCLPSYTVTLYLVPKRYIIWRQNVSPYRPMMSRQLYHNELYHNVLFGTIRSHYTASSILSYDAHSRYTITLYWFHGYRVY